MRVHRVIRALAMTIGLAAYAHDGRAVIVCPDRASDERSLARDEAWRQYYDSVQQALSGSSDPRDRALAAFAGDFSSDERVRAEALARSAADAAADDMLVQWVALRRSQVASGNYEPMLSRLEQHEPDNAAVWLEVLVRAIYLQDRATADELARASITVLRAGGLPLRGRIFVVSPVNPDIALITDQPSLGQVLAQRLPNVSTQTITLSPIQADIDRAVAAARGADVVVLGSADLFSYPQQAALAKALQATKPTVLVSLRSPYDILSAPGVAGYVCAYTGREPTLRALADVLTGTRPPTGTLPVDVPGVYRIGDGMKKL